MGTHSTAADLLDLWPTLIGEERMVYRIRLTDPAMTLLVDAVADVEPQDALSEGRVEIRGRELHGSLAHIAGEVTSQGGVAEQVRVRICERRQGIEILDLDEPNEPPRPGHEPEQDLSAYVEANEMSQETLAEVNGFTEEAEEPPAGVEIEAEPPAGVEIPADHPTWEVALAAAGMPNADGVIDATGGWDEVRPVEPTELYCRTIPVKEWTSTSPLKLPRPVLDELSEVASDRMLGRTLLIAYAIERGLAAIKADQF